jgi:hypothetical protein
MEPINQTTITDFLKRLGESFPIKSSFYLLGGSALCLLGSPRQTVDIDYIFMIYTVSHSVKSHQDLMQTLKMYYSY